MSVDRLFDLSFLVVAPFWLLMIFAPRWRWTRRIVASPWIAAPAAVLYVVLVVPGILEIVPLLLRPELGALSGLLATPTGATIAWVHFLAFDLFVGRWVYLDGDDRKASPWLMAPILFLTLMVGPLGLLAYLLLRRSLGPRLGPRPVGTRRPGAAGTPDAA